MNPIYKFELATEYNGVTNNYAVYPLRKADLAKDYELQQNQKFYRAKLSGKLLFSRADYAIIANARFETKFTLVISISWNNGQTWTEYWRGEFWKTDCKFDTDAQTAEVTPAPVDDYTAVLAGMEKEYNLIELKPDIERLKLSKRPMLQIYVAGDSIISCFLSGMYWEQECNAEENDTKLRQDYHFASLSQKTIHDIIGEVNISMAETTTAEYTYSLNEESGTTGNYWVAELVRSTDGARWYRESQTQPNYPFVLNADQSTAASESVTVYERTIRIYGRYVLDVEQLGTQSTYDISPNDIVENNRNYKYVIGYSVANTIELSTRVTDIPNEWGIVQPGTYYKEPRDAYGVKYFPIGRNQWTWHVSIWYKYSGTDWPVEVQGRKQYELRDSYPLHSAISALLAKIAPGITHEPTSEYSQFLYDTYNPISGDVFDLYITQKSNILAGDYSQPAQKAPITLKMITDMLRNVYCAYWYIEDGKFKVEHIQWFKNGGGYTGTPDVPHNLTVEKVTRNGKPWAFGTSQYEFNKPTMPERYQFGWMDDVTQPFNGKPIEVLSKFVNAGNIEEVNVSNFTSDIDYMLLNPGAISKDGFALMAAVNGVLPFVEKYINGVLYIHQNGLLSFEDLQPKYWIYDLPAYNVRINDVSAIAYGITREKKQTLRFPVKDDPNPMHLIKTYMGNGQVEKISVNLSSRSANVTLMYDTQNYNE